MISYKKYFFNFCIFIFAPNFAFKTQVLKAFFASDAKKIAALCSKSYIFRHKHCSKTVIRENFGKK